jgi:hypothetical protein
MAPKNRGPRRTCFHLWIDSFDPHASTQSSAMTHIIPFIMVHLMRPPPVRVEIA